MRASFYTIPLARRAGKTIAVDISSRMLEKAASHATKNEVNVEFMQTDGTHIKLSDGTVDLILLGHVFHEVEDRPGVLDEFFRIIKPSGRLAVVERTHSSSFLSGKLGPPVLKVDEIIREIEQAGFKSDQTIPHGKDTIIICRKP